MKVSSSSVRLRQEVMSRREKDEYAKCGAMRELPKLLSEVMEDTSLNTRSYKHCQSPSNPTGSYCKAAEIIILPPLDSGGTRN